jgi:hypothetical protein
MNSVLDTEFDSLVIISNSYLIYVSDWVVVKGSWSIFPLLVVTILRQNFHGGIAVYLTTRTLYNNIHGCGIRKPYIGHSCTTRSLLLGKVTIHKPSTLLANELTASKSPSNVPGTLSSSASGLDAPMSYG